MSWANEPLPEERQFGADALICLADLKKAGGTEEETWALLFTLGGLADGEARKPFTIEICGQRVHFDGRRFLVGGTGRNGRVLSADEAIASVIMGGKSGGRAARGDPAGGGEGERRRKEFRAGSCPKPQRWEAKEGRLSAE